MSKELLNPILSRRQAIGAGLGLLASVSLAGCGGSSSSNTTAASSSKAAAGSIDTDAFDALVASIEPADDATIEANAWAKAIKEAGVFQLGALRTSILFSQYDEQDGVARGFDAGIYLSLIRYILGDETKYEFHQVNSDTRESVLQNETVDAVVCTYTITDKRKELVDFAGPYFTAHQGILVLADNEDINSLEDMDGKTVACEAGSVGPSMVEQYCPGATVSEFTSDDECRLALEQGRVDAYLTDNTILMSHFVEEPGTFRFAVEEFGPDDSYGIGLTKGEEGALEFVNAFLQKFEDDGKWNELYQICVADLIDSDTIPEPPTIAV